MKSLIRFRKDSQTGFVKLFSELCNSKSSWEVWADFVVMSAIAISNAFNPKGPTHDAREQEYMRTIQRYTKAEQQIFPKLLAATVEALEAEPDQDFLGVLFMGLNLGNHWKGQFFTPYNISRMIAEIQLCGIEFRLKKKGWVGINDPCCGAGALLIAARNIMVREKLAPTSALYVAQDIDRTAALMCYIQLSLLGCAGYVVVADTFRHPLSGYGNSPLLNSPTPEQEVWLTPALYDETWCARMQLEKMRLILEHLGKLDFEQKTKSVSENGKETGMSPDVRTMSQTLNESAWGQLKLF
ncbi:MAG: SAM-dependent methyltransferase [Oscillospiraceae bacterium]|nr:SAM-dependent methyltransferase [Oscillospiraceae bacterium]